MNPERAQLARVAEKAIHGHFAPRGLHRRVWRAANLGIAPGGLFILWLFIKIG